MDTTTVTRKDLYNLVWSKPISTLSNDYQIGENELRKICLKYRVPLLKNGYWMKLQFGKPAEIERLEENWFRVLLK